jgi:hypothetical protein
MTAVEFLLEEINKLTGLTIAMDEPCVEQALEMEQEQGEYNLMDCKRIVHEGFVYVKLNDLLHVKKKFQQ